MHGGAKVSWSLLQNPDDTESRIVSPLGALLAFSTDIGNSVLHITASRVDPHLAKIIFGAGCLETSKGPEEVIMLLRE